MPAIVALLSALISYSMTHFCPGLDPGFPTGSPVLLSLSLGQALGPALLGMALSAGAFAAIATYALRMASRETGESEWVLIGRARSRVQDTIGRARTRWESGEVRTSWNRQRRTGLRLVVGVLIGQAAVVLGMATGSKSLLGPGTAAFAVTVTVVTCLLANAVLSLLWLAGPAAEGEARLVAVSPEKDAPSPLQQLFAPRAGSPALPPKN